MNMKICLDLITYYHIEGHVNLYYYVHTFYQDYECILTYLLQVSELFSQQVWIRAELHRGEGGGGVSGPWHRCSKEKICL